MTGLETCRQCGAKLSPRTVEGLCPACLARLTFQVLPQTGEDMPEARSPAVGQNAAGLEFADYLLLEEVGRGGMGVVYKARQRSLNRVVALKMILSGRFASKEFVQRFRAEAEAAAALQHPNIVAIHEVGEHDGQHYFTMDYVEGRSLAELVRDNPLPAERAARYVRVITEAVHYAHQCGTLHRDLKPSNVLVDPHDQPRITDFGLAKRLNNDSDLTVTGKALGSPGYMPPEQAQGERGRVGPHSDVYSLGALLYHLLTGRSPFWAETAEATLAEVLQRDPVSPRSLNPGVPADLETICLKCLEKEPQRRYPTARELADELDRFLHLEPIHARPIGPVGKIWRWCERSPVVASLAGLAVLLFAAGFSGVLWQWRRAEGLAHSESAQRGRAERALGQLELQRAEDLLQSHQAAEALAYLAHVRRKSPSNESVAFRIMSVLSQRSFALPTVPPMRHEGPVFSVEFSPDGARVATASRDNTARVWDALTGRAVAGPLQHTGVVNTARFSSNGQWVVTASDDNSARVWDALTGEPLTPPLRHEGAVVSARFSPDGLKVVTASLDKTARIWSVKEGQPQNEAIQHGDELVDASFAPDGRTVLTASQRDGLVLVSDAKSGTVRRRFQFGTPVRSARFSPEGRRVAVATQSGFARILDWITGRGIATLHHRDVVHDAVFSPDGELLATVSSDRRALLWDAWTGELAAELPGHQTWVESAEFTRDGLCLLTQETSSRALVWDVLSGRQIGQPIQASGLLYDARFSPDGQQVAVASIAGAAQLWTVVPGRSLPLILGHSNNLVSTQISPDGRKVATGSADGSLTLWDANTGESEKEFKHNGPVVSVQFSPDGTRILSVSADNTACVWRLQDNEKVSVQEPAVRVAQFSPNGNSFLTATSDGTIRTWMTETGQPLAGEAMHHGSMIWHAEFSPDGRLIATASGNYTARLWDAHTGQARSQALEHRRGIRYISFSPDGSRVVTASRDHTAATWSVATGERLVEMRHNGQLRCARFSADGRQIVTASFDNTARVWDAATGDPLTESLRHKAEVQYAEFSPDGRWVVSAALDGTVRVWDARSGKPVTESLEHHDNVSLARFSADGRRLITGARLTRIWELPSLALPVPDFLADLAEGVAGQRLDERGSFRPVDSENLLRIKEGSKRSTRDDDHDRWAQWFFADRTKRTISPSLSLTAAESARRIAKENSLEGVMEAVRLAPTNGAACTRLARLILTQPGYEDPFNAVRAEVWSRRAVALSPEDPETWLAHSEIQSQRRKSEAALTTLDSGTARHPDDARLWHRKGQLLAEKGLRADAVEAFQRANLHSGKLTEAQRNRLLADSGNALSQLNRSESKIPARHPETPATCLDLSTFYNAALSDDWHGKQWTGNNLATLPTGRQPLAGVEFDVRGIIQLAGQVVDQTAAGFPQRVASIPVGQACRRLHFLHAAGWGNAVPVGTLIGSYVIHYADGEQAEVPLRNGEDLAEWQIGPNDPKDLKRATVAWTGRNARTIHVQLFRHTWENPRPHVSVASLDFDSAMTHAAPFVVAITAEP